MFVMWIGSERYGKYHHKMMTLILIFGLFLLSTETAKMTSNSCSAVLSIYCFLLSLFLVNGQLAEKLSSQNPCVSKATCHDCIQTKSCAWCLQPQADYGDLPRCFQPSYGVGDSRCPEEYTYNPDNEMIPLLNMELTRRVSGAAAEGGGAMAGGYSASGYSSSGSSYQASSSSSSHYGSSSSSGSTYGFGAAASGGIVQISPQRVKLKLRISE